MSLELIPQYESMNHLLEIFILNIIFIKGNTCQQFCDTIYYRARQTTPSSFKQLLTNRPGLISKIKRT